MGKRPLQNNEIAARIAELDLRKISGIYTRKFLDSTLHDISTRGSIHPNIKKKIETILHYYDDPKFRWGWESKP